MRTRDIHMKPDNLLWLACNVTNESVSSAIDIIYLGTEYLTFVNKTQSLERVSDLRSNLRGIGYNTPMLFANYRTLKRYSNDSDAELRGYIDNETVAHDNSLFFGPEGWFTFTNDEPFMGFSRQQW